MKKYLLGVLILTLLVGCMSSPNYRYSAPAYKYDNLDDNNPLAPQKKSNSLLSFNQAEPQKTKESIDKKKNNDKMVVYNASVNITTEMEFDTINSKIRAYTENNDGFVINFSNNSIDIRVPSAKLDDCIKFLEEFGELNKYIYGRDVTDEYFDSKLKLEQLEKFKERYYDLLQKAKDVKEAVEVEKELQKVIAEIEVLKGKLNRLQSEIAYSKISIHFNKKVTPGILGYVFVYTYKAVAWLFVQ